MKVKAKPTYEELESRVHELEKIESEYKSSQEALRKSENQLRLLSENIPLGYQSLDNNGYFIDVNKTWLDALGYEKEEVFGKSFADFLHPDWRDHFKENYSGFRSIGENMGVELEMVKKNGDPILVSFIGKINKDEKGNFYQSHCIFHDVIARKRSENKQKENVKLLNSTLEAVDSLIVVIDKEHRILLCNWKDHEWVSAEEREKRPYCYKIMKNFDSPCEGCPPTKTFRDGQPRWYVDQNPIDGSYKEISVIPIFSDSGAVEYVLENVRDITERKQAEEALRESELRFHHLFQSVPNIAIQGYGPDGTIRYWNEASEHLYGYTAQEAIGRNLIDLIIPTEMRSEVEQTIRLMAETRQKIPASEVSLMRKDGSRVPVFSSHAIVQTPGQTPELYCIDIDMTSQKRSEEALRQSYAMLARTERIANVGSWEWDIETDLVRWSDELFHIFQRDPARGAPGFKEHPDIYIAEDMNRLQNAVETCISKGTPYELELRAIRTDGMIRHCIARGQSEFDRAGHVIRLVGSLQDITERKQVEDALRESEAKFRSIYEHTAVGLAQVSLDFKIMSANEAYCNMLGCQEKDLVGSHLKEITHPDVIERNIQEQANLASGKIDHYRMEKIFIHKNGQAVHAILDANLIRDVSGKAIYFLGSVVDITERKQAEKALQESEERFKKLSSFTFEGIVIHNNAIAIDVNQSFVKMLGYERDDIIGTNLFKFIHPDDHETTKVNLSKLVATPYEIRIIRKDDSTFYAEIEARNISYNNEYFRVACVRDITERKQAEAEKEKLQAQLIQAQKMESVGRLAGGVAHDFNNMLGVILGHTEMALDEVDPSTPLYTNLQAVQQAAEHSADLTRQLLTFARKQTIAPKVINLNQTLEGMLKMLRRLIGEDIDLLWKPGGNLAPVKVDPSQIDQVLVNLCVNARDAIVDMGKITIETGIVSFDEEYCADHPGFVVGEYVLLAVSDNGCGMDQETIGHLFEPFFTTKQPGQGTGLGLASVYGAVKQNNGFISVYSEPGQGTTFKIYLPQHQASAPRHADRATAKPVAGGSETILLVEDEPAILDMATMMLKRLGYIVIAAKTPGEAIRLAHEHSGPIDLLLTDVVMPEMNGRDLAKNLLTIYPDIRRLFMSGYTANVIAHHGVLDEGVHFIQKPFSSKDLGAKLREILEDKDAG